MNELNRNFQDIAIGFAKDHYSSKFNLDFSERSIQDLDNFIEELSNMYLSKEVEPSFDVKMTLGCAGIYLGEVIKKKVQTQWIKKDKDIILDAGQFQFNPIWKVFKRFFEGEEYNVYGFYMICINHYII